MFVYHSLSTLDITLELSRRENSNTCTIYRLLYIFRCIIMRANLVRDWLGSKSLGSVLYIEE